MSAWLTACNVRSQSKSSGLDLSVSDDISLSHQAKRSMVLLLSTDRYPYANIQFRHRMILRPPQSTRPLGVRRFHQTNDTRVPSGDLSCRKVSSQQIFWLASVGSNAEVLRTALRRAPLADKLRPSGEHDSHLSPDGYRGNTRPDR